MKTRKITVSLFYRGYEGLRFNPYIVIGQREICIDRDGILFSGPRHSFGYIRGAGFHFTRHL